MVGVGNIGSEIVRIGRGLGMEVWGVDPARKHDFVDYVEYGEKKPEADIMVCAMNLTGENCGYFNEGRLSGIKPGALFINIARGELSPPGVLLKKLKSGQLGGVGIDVYDAESELAVALRTGRSSENPVVRALLELREMPNVICTPHNAFNTKEAVLRKSEQSIQQAESYLDTGTFIWVVPG